jgi:hypothetical protein
MVHISADVRETIWCLDNLARPAVCQLDARQDATEVFLQLTGSRRSYSSS